MIQTVCVQYRAFPLANSDQEGFELVGLLLVQTCILSQLPVKSSAGITADQDHIHYGQIDRFQEHGPLHRAVRPLGPQLCSNLEITLLFPLQQIPAADTIWSLKGRAGNKMITWLSGFWA